MRLRSATSLLLVLVLFVSLLASIAQSAVASESVPQTNYPPVPVSRYTRIVSGVNGSITLPCNTLDAGRDLVTYDQSGKIVRALDHTQYLDGVSNCLTDPIVDNKGVLYGVSHGKAPDGTFVTGDYLYAFTGNTLKWRYPLKCSDSLTSTVVGGNGTIYATTRQSDGVHLVGIAPELTSGASQPAKVLDVKIANDCTIKLQAFKDGIVAHGQLSGNAWYYSYAGKFLGQALIGDVWNERINAEGQLFVPKQVTGNGFLSATVSKYDPLTGVVVWTSQASTPQADTKGISVYPLPNGGVTAHVIQQRMLTGGIPATPTEWQSTLVTFNAAGQKLYTAVLPSTNGQGSTYEHAYTIVDTGGKVTTLQYMYMPTGLSYPTTVSAIAIRVYDPATNTWLYQNAIRGDISKPGGPYGYFLDAPSAVTTGTVAAIGKCSGNCPGNTWKLFAIKVPSLGLDYPRGTVLTTRPRAQYLAFGDSFSSGESVKPFTPSTDLPGVNQCHRSNYAYPQLIAGSSLKIPSLGIGGFRACAGATSDNIWTKNEWNEGIQLDPWPNMAAGIVTITIGGNDIGFGDFAKACATSSCDMDTSVYRDTISRIENELPNKLETTYRKLLQYAPNAKVYVLGYPNVVADKTASDIIDARCPYLYDGGTHWGDARAARDVIKRLNAKITATVAKIAVGNANNFRLYFVPLDEENSPFSGHEICGTSNSWFQNIDQVIVNKDYVFHPNMEGQRGYATVAITAINAN